MNINKTEMRAPTFINDWCIVSLSNSPWEHPFWVSRQFLMYELAKFCPVIYATGRTQIRKLFTVNHLKDVWFPQAPPFLPPETLLVQKTPLTIPKILKYSKADRLLANAYGRRLRKKCRKIDCKKIIAYVWEPKHMDLLAGLRPDLVVYHPYDKFEAMARRNEHKARIRQLENEMVQKADIVIAPSQKIADSLHHQNARVMHNGVFTPAMDGYNHQTNAQFQGIPRPRIGYIGMISAKLDYSLILETARIKPDVSIILMGPQNLPTQYLREKIMLLQQMPNIFFFPAVGFDRVFEHMMQLDMGMMPYSLSGHAGYCESPLKMYQYWLCGLPVITTRLPNIVEEPGIIYHGNTPAEWTEKITAALANDSRMLMEKRQKKARENSWKKRAETIFKLLMDTILTGKTNL